MTEANLPKVAVVGRPNVGKSTLVNRLAGRRESITGPASGLTRDRLSVEAEWQGKHFLLSDTGGLLEQALGWDASGSITGKVAASALKAIDTADLVLFVVDGEVGVTSDDLALAGRLRKLEAPVIVVANKIDSQRDEAEVPAFWTLGLGEPAAVSAQHGRGTGDLLDRIVELLPEVAGDETVEIPCISIVGRPNVGKSSLFNRLIGDERSIVHEEPGTTRDSVDSLVTVDGRQFRFVDTAGVRRRSKTHDVEIYSASRTRQAIARSDVSILMIDAVEGAAAQDQRIARQVAETGVGAIVVLNKWDLIVDDEAARIVERSVADRLRFVDYAARLRTSALTGRGLNKIFPHIERVLETRNRRIPTAELNELVSEAQQKAPPPGVGTSHSKVLYATQASIAPPTFVLFTSAPLTISWQRFLERRLREEFDFTGNPIRLVVRERTRRGGRKSAAERRGAAHEV